MKARDVTLLRRPGSPRRLAALAIAGLAASAGAIAHAALAAALPASALALLAPAALAQDAEGAPDAPAPLTEKELLADFNKAFGTKDVSQRVAAITAFGDATRDLEDQGSSKAVAKALAKGLDDDELEVRAAAVAQIGHGRNVDTVIPAFKKFLEDQKSQIERRITRPDEESRTYVNRGAVVFNDGAYALANYRDDRSLDVLSSLLRSLRPNSESNNLSTRLVGALAGATLELGTHDAVEAVVKQTQTYSADDGYQESAARRMHEALTQFATRIGHAGPQWSELHYVAWHDWFEERDKDFPKKLGRLKDPPPARGSEEMGQGSGVDGQGGNPAPR